MTLTELRDTLASVHDAGPVPPVDALGVQRRVESARRRRGGARVLAAAAAVAAVGAGAALLPGDDSSPPVVSPAAPRDLVPVVLDGELALVGPDGATPTGVQVSGLVGQGDNGVVTLDPERHVVVVQLTDDGIGVVRDLSAGPVGGVALSADGKVLAWVDENRELHERGSADGSWSWSFDTATESGFRGVLLAVDGPDWLAWEDGRAMLHRPASGLDPLLLDSMRGLPQIAALAGDRAAIVIDDLASFYDTGTGEWTITTAVAAQGALSPTGELWAGADVVTDTTSVRGRVLAGHVRGAPVSTWWRDEDRYAVVTEAGGHRLLWDCSVADARCTQTYDDPTGSMMLPG